jgi:hypothetical protein
MLAPLEADGMKLFLRNPKSNCGEEDAFKLNVRVSQLEEEDVRRHKPRSGSGLQPGVAERYAGKEPPMKTQPCQGCDIAHDVYPA